MEKCLHGHELTPENSYYKIYDGVRQTKPSCLECKRIQCRRSANRQTPAQVPYRWYGDKCANGHLLNEETAGQRMTAAGVRLYCRACTRERVAESRKQGANYHKPKSSGRKARKMGDRCMNGHLLTPETTKFYRGRVSPDCLICKRERDRKYKLAHPESQENRRARRTRAVGKKRDRHPKTRANPDLLRGAYNRQKRDRYALNAAVQDERLLGDQISKADDERPGAVWNLLKPTGKAREALHDLHARQDEVLDAGGSWNCRDNPEPFMDSWLDEDEQGEFPTPPAPNRVRAMCEGCPLLVVCQQYGIVSRDPGIWGGLRVGLDGKIYD